MRRYSIYESPLGEILIISNGDAVTGVYLPHQKHGQSIRSDWVEAQHDPVIGEACKQLGQYFTGLRTTFDLPLEAQGTPFQKRVWQRLKEIPYGETISYKELAMRNESPGAIRAVGQANGRNPISIVIPCHRVIGANGSLTGYGGGIHLKEALLVFEKAVAAGRGQPFSWKP